MRKRAFSEDVGLFAAVMVLTAAFFSGTAGAQTAGKQLLQNSLPPVVSHLSPIGRLPEGTSLHLAIGLPLRNENALDHLLQQIYDPASPNFHHYLTPEQFNEQFGPTETDYQTVENFFENNGFKVTAHGDHRLLDVSGSAADIERVFHVTMRTYQHPTENRTFFSADAAPSLDLSVPILHVSGLDNYSLIRPRIALKKSLNHLAKTTAPRSGSGPEGMYLGNDLRAAYLPGVSLTGAGQTLGLLEFDGYYSNDITTYENDAGLSPVTLTNVPVQGGVSTPGSGNVEVALDIEIAMSIAPGLSKIVVYEAPNNSSYFDDILQTMADDTNNSPQQFSCSWGATSPGAPDTTAEGYFKQMDVQRQSFFNAAGDSDAFVGGVPFPSESTNIMQVGGTTLTTSGPGGAWVQETTWNWGGNHEGNSSIGTCGGISDNFGIPYWQQGINMSANEGSTTMRNVPDVAMPADNIFVVADNGFSYYVGGTSCAAPAWAAFMALVNQQAVSGGQSTAGFINPAIYAIGKGANYTSDFRDVVTGNNFWASSTNEFPAVPGYDLCTGWGTPGGDTLIDALAGVSDSLSVAPGTGFVGFGPPGGPFTSSSRNFYLTNSGASPLNWSLLNLPTWLTASATGGTLSPGGPATNVVVSLNAAAYNLPLGTYTTGIVFSNQTSQATRTRQFTLLAGQSLIQNGNFNATLDIFGLADWAQSGGIGYQTSYFNKFTYPTYNFDFIDSNGVTSGISPHSSIYLFVFGTYGAVGYISQNIPTVPGQSYLLSFWFTCPTAPVSGYTEQFLVNWNTNSATTNTILNMVNPAAFGWTYTNFVLAATSTNTLLQIGARNDPEWFGLQNVSVLPIPTPDIRSFFRIRKTEISSMTWNTQTGMVYQVQYSPYIGSNNWFNLSTNIAAGPTLTVTNPIGPNTELFYRVLRLP